MKARVVHCTEPLVSTPALFVEFDEELVELDELDELDELVEVEMTPPCTVAGMVVFVVALAAVM